MSTVALRVGESLADYAIRVTEERDKVVALLRDVLPVVRREVTRYGYLHHSGDDVLKRFAAALKEEA